MPLKVTHNNDGHFYTIDVDLAKEGAEVFDLTTYFKARVGDNGFGLRVRWFWQGQLYNTVGKKPHVEGVVGQYSFKKANNDVGRELVMSPDADPVSFTGDVNDCQADGYATYYFPQQMFPQDGMFKGTIGLLDDSGKTARYTSVDIWFKVYPNAGGAQMGKACDYYISELDKAIKEAEEDLKAGQKVQQQIIDEYRQKVTDLINQINGQAADVQATLANLKTSIQALEDKIAQDKIFTQGEADAFKKSLNDQFNEKMSAAIAEIKSYGLVSPKIRQKIVYNGYWSNLDLSHSGGVYTSTLDSIKNEIDQMAPLADGVTLIFHQYITGGKLVVLENLDTFKQAIAYAKSQGLSIAGYKFHCETSIDDIKSYGVSEFFADYKANVDKVTSALPEAGVPLVLFNERGDLYGATSPYSGNVRNILQDLIGATFKVDISFQSLQDFINADPHIQEIVDAILVNSYARISDKQQSTTLTDVSTGLDTNFYNLAKYVHSMYPKKQMIMSEFGIKSNWAAFDETWNWNFSSVYDDSTGTVPYLYLRGLMQSETVNLFSEVWLWFYADLLQSEAGKEYLRAYKKGVI